MNWHWVLREFQNGWRNPSHQSKHEKDVMWRNICFHPFLPSRLHPQDKAFGMLWRTRIGEGRQSRRESVFPAGQKGVSQLLLWWSKPLALGWTKLTILENISAQERHRILLSHNKSCAEIWRNYLHYSFILELFESSSDWMLRQLQEELPCSSQFCLSAVDTILKQKEKNVDLQVRSEPAAFFLFCFCTRMFLLDRDGS